MIITTGFGYYVDIQGHIAHKYQLPIGKHPDPTGYTFVEVADQSALDKIQIYTIPLKPAQLFNVNQFCQDLFTNFSSDSNLFGYYAVLKDLALFQNFSGMKNIVNSLVTAGTLNQTEVALLNTILANQNIVLNNF